jgi:protein ImuB
MIVERVRWQVDGWLRAGPAERPTAGVTSVRLVPDEVVAATGRQLGFWGGASREGERAARALARLQGLLGPDAVCLPQQRGGRRPDEQIALVPLGVVDPATLAGQRLDRRVAAPWPGALPTPSAAVLHDPPLPVAMCDVDGAPVRVSGRGALSAAPQHLQIGERWVTLVGWAGPWLLDERWWDPTHRHRQARFQVVTAPGSAHLVVLEGQRWWLAATYD